MEKAFHLLQFCLTISAFIDIEPLIMESKRKFRMDPRKKRMEQVRDGTDLLPLDCQTHLLSIQDDCIAFTIASVIAESVMPKRSLKESIEPCGIN